MDNSESAFTVGEVSDLSAYFAIQPCQIHHWPWNTLRKAVSLCRVSVPQLGRTNTTVYCVYNKNCYILHITYLHGQRPRSQRWHVQCRSCQVQHTNTVLSVYWLQPGLGGTGPFILLPSNLQSKYPVSLCSHRDIISRRCRTRVKQKNAEWCWAPWSAWLVFLHFDTLPHQAPILSSPTHTPLPTLYKSTNETPNLHA